MASETNTDRINRLEQNVAKLVTRVDALNFKTAQIEDRSREIELFSKELDKRLSLLADKSERWKEDLDEIRTKRWEIGKIVLTAVLSSALGLLVGRLLKSMARMKDRPTPSSALPTPSRSTTKPSTGSPTNRSSNMTPARPKMPARGNPEPSSLRHTSR